MYYNGCKTNHKLSDVIETIGNNISNFDPIRGFNYFNENLSDMFNGAGEAFKNAKNILAAKLDILEDDNVYEVVMELTGVNKEDVKILAKDEASIEIKATKKVPNLDEGSKRFIHQERTFGDVTRTINFQKSIIKDSISAKWLNGELIITIPKLKPAEPKEIQIIIE